MRLSRGCNYTYLSAKKRQSRAMRKAKDLGTGILAVFAIVVVLALGIMAHCAMMDDCMSDGHSYYECYHYLSGE